MNPRTLTEINFRLGWPNPGLLPVEEVKDATQIALSLNENFTKESLLQYGPDDGYVALREKIARWLTSFYTPQKLIDLDRICITGGASQNLSCVLQSFTDPSVTKSIWMIAPTYFCACRVFDDAGFAGRLRAVPEDDEGIDIAYLAEQLESCDAQDEVPKPAIKTSRTWSKFYRHIIYAVPTFANPSGRVMSLTRREALVRLARKHDALIVSDDVYDMLQWNSDPSNSFTVRKTACQPRFVDIDSHLDGGPIDDFGNSMSNGTFSKILGPGLRTGWAEGTPKFSWGLSQTGSTRSGGCPSQFGAAILTQMLDKTLSSYLQNVLQPNYARRYHKLMEAIRFHLLPLGVSIVRSDKSGVAGGYYVWLQLPITVNVKQVINVALQQQNLLLHPGSMFLVEGDKLKCQSSFLNGLRVCFVWVEEDLLVQGVKRLGSVLEALS